MRFRFVLAVSLLTVGFSLASVAQQAPTASSPQALQLLQSAIAALSSAPLNDVTLTGTARRIAGSDDETGTATLKAVPGAGRIDLNLSSGPRSEIQNVSGASSAGTWSGPDGISHPIAPHNLLAQPSWWFPIFILSKFVPSQNAAAVYVGSENRSGNSVIHISAYQQFPGRPSSVAARLQRLSETQIFLNPSTFLPEAIEFSTHPDNDSSLDIPIEIDFSDYRLVTGSLVPFHIQKYINNTMTLDIQIQHAALNSGVSPASFTIPLPSDVLGGLR